MLFLLYDFKCHKLNKCNKFISNNIVQHGHMNCATIITATTKFFTQINFNEPSFVRRSLHGSNQNREHWMCVYSLNIFYFPLGLWEKCTWWNLTYFKSRIESYSCRFCCCCSSLIFIAYELLHWRRKNV